jgi:hypothetical protein
MKFGRLIELQYFAHTMLTVAVVLDHLCSSALHLSPTSLRGFGWRPNETLGARSGRVGGDGHKGMRREFPLRVPHFEAREPSVTSPRGDTQCNSAAPTDGLGKHALSGRARLIRTSLGMQILASRAAESAPLALRFWLQHCIVLDGVGVGIQTQSGLAV